jgi:hypothetical protein
MKHIELYTGQNLTPKQLLVGKIMEAYQSYLMYCKNTKGERPNPKSVKAEKDLRQYMTRFSNKWYREQREKKNT